MKQLRTIFIVCLVSISQLIWSQEKPNVLHLITDDLNNWVFISNKYQAVRTPSTSRLAKSKTCSEKYYSQPPIYDTLIASFLFSLLPSIISGTDLQQSKLNHNAVSLIDIYPTLVDLCGLTKTKQNDGGRLSQILRS